METSEEILIEIAKNKSDAILVKNELEREKQNFIYNMENSWANEIENPFIVSKPIKIPKKAKFKEFLRKLKKTFGF